MTKFVRAHREALRVSSELTLWFRRAREPQVLKVTVEGVLATLHKAQINPVLMGAHGLNVYRSETRATQDVDVLIIKKDVRKAVKVLEREYPYLVLADNSAVTRLFDPVTQKPVIDVMKPSSDGMRVVFRHSIRIGETHRIPDLEMAIVCKFWAMTSPNRRQAKQQVDLGDFIDIVETNRDALDLVKLKRIADVTNPRRGNEILRIVEDIDAGRRVRL